MAPGADATASPDSKSGDSARARKSTGRKSGDGKPKVRRRTKSGCLTCRKRRIKCDECRPICNNCIKSKRDCEGYNPRLGFKDVRSDSEDLGSLYAFPGPAALPPFFQANPFALPPTATPLTPIRPRPEFDPSFYPVYESGEPNFYAGSGPEVSSDPLGAYRAYNHIPVNSHYQIDPNVPIETAWTEGIGFTAADAFEKPVSTNPSLAPSDSGNPQASPHSSYPDQLAPSPVTNVTSQSTHSDPYGFSSRGSDKSSPSQWGATEVVPPAEKPVLAYPNGQRAINQERPDRIAKFDKHSAIDLPQNFPRHKMSTANVVYGDDNSNIAQTLEDAAVEYQDDDYHDVFSDEEDENIQANMPSSDWKSANFRDSSHLHQAGRHDSNSRAPINNGMLETYRPERVANPLRNPNTARVFSNFVTSFGPLLSLHERILRPTQMPTDQAPPPFAPPMLWNYTIPMMAMHNQSLLHAMLAVSSLQIARVQKTPTTPSLKHYAYSLKRVHHAVSHQRKRHETTTLAATLLLGFYEIMTAEHAKWSTHVNGATQLIKEIDYKTIRVKLAEFKRHRQQNPHASVAHFNRPNGNMEVLSSGTEHLPDLDDGLIDVLMGLSSNRLPAMPTQPPSRVLTDLEVRDLEVLQDLFWWHRKQDIYHSLISGNELLMDYRRWSDCPPRAPINFIGAVYGTFDHLILLLGRISTFVAKDRTRKVRVLSANGGVWRPPAAMSKTNPRVESPFSPFPATCSTTGTSGPQDRPISIPFYGMAPSYGTPHMPRAFQARRPSPPSRNYSLSQAEEVDLETATQIAIEEWGDIRAAFTTFANCLGPEFQPLKHTQEQPIQSPFGPGITYRSHDIGNMWLHYYLGLIVTIRSHPSMPPAAHMAAGVAAPQTVEWANEIGRISAGIVPTPQLPGLSASDAALPGCAMSLFFAGVQYQDPAQRLWTVTRLLDIGDQTGFGSANICANGCETAWVKAAELGRGPPYQRICCDLQSPDERVNLRQSESTGQPDPMSRRNVRYNRGARVVWATGVLGMADDFSRVTLDDAAAG